MATAGALAGIFGEKESGPKLRATNVAAIQSVANILKTSLGPQGLDKMIVDSIGDVTMTNDGATILDQLEVEHPAAKVLVDLSRMQDQEAGDGTTSVVLMAAELLANADKLIQEGVHPTTVISGFRVAAKEAVNYIKSSLTLPASAVTPAVLKSVAATSIRSKFIAADSDHFAEIITQALAAVKKIDDIGDVKVPFKAVNIVQTHGRSLSESFVVPGYALARLQRVSQGMPSTVTNAKIAFIDFGLKQYRLHMGVRVDLQDPAELELIRQKEKDVTKTRIQKILASGATVILSSHGIDDMAAKYFVEANAMAVRRVDPKDLRRIAKVTGGKVVTTLATLDDEEESFSSANLGKCDSVSEERVGDWDFIFFRSKKPVGRASTIVLRGANDFVLDEVERSLVDGLSSVARAMESNEVCPGGGAVEVALSVYLDDFARTLGSREELAVAAFASSLEVIPKTLAMNASKDSLLLLSKLRVNHVKSQRDANEKELRWSGLDLTRGEVRNNISAGVLESANAKIKAIKFATEAAVTILRIDDLITLKADPQRPQ